MKNIINISDEFISELNTIIKIKSTNDILDYIFEYIDILILNNKLYLIDDIFKKNRNLQIY